MAFIFAKLAWINALTDGSLVLIILKKRSLHWLARNWH